jgi:hypothetical protein
MSDDCPTILELRKDTATLKQLADLEEFVDVPIQRGGVYFSEWEKEFIKNVRRRFDGTLEFSEKEREKIKEIWQAADLRKRASPEEKTENLFSKLSPERQAEQRAKAKGILPWEK